MPLRPTLPRLGRPRLGFQRIVDRHPIRVVERVGVEESTSFPADAVWDEVRKLYRSALHPAIALHVRHEGRVVLDRTLGHLWNAPGGEVGPVVTPDTLFNLFSASKIVTSALVLALAEDGLLSVDDPVAAHLPGFARHGKSAIRIRHLLQHTAGIPDMPRLPDLESVLRSGRVELEMLYDLVPTSAPGERTAYHALTSWFLVQAILEQAGGADLRTLLRRRILDPLGFEHLSYGVAPEAVDRVARHAVTGLRTPAFMAGIFDRNIGLGVEQAVEITNRAEFLTSVLPSANVVATPREVGRFMQLLLQGGTIDGVRVLSPASVQRMITDVTPLKLDGTFRLPMRYGLGVMMGNDLVSLFGFGTAGAFGHLGLSNVVVYADPSRDLSVAFLNTGKPMLAPGMVRWYAVLQAIASRVPRRRPVFPRS